MTRHVVAPVSEIAPGTCKIVSISGRSIGVYNVKNEFFALINRCPHEGAPLCAGLVVGTNEYAPDAPGRLRRVKDGQIVRCPWHHWEFDITTGLALAHPRKRVRTYEVEVADGKVYLTA